ncbi:MAG: HIG1 domain-containing protein [Pseudomonadota bacterium]
MDYKFYLVLVPMLLTFIILIMGLLVMAMGDRINKKYSNMMMQARVIMQVITVLLLMVLFVDM